MARQPPKPQLTMMVVWPYDDIPELYTEVTIDGRKVGKVVAIHETARKVELELVVDSDIAGAMMSPGTRPR